MVGAIAATATVTAFVADAQPGRTSANASDTTSIDGGISATDGGGAVTTLPRSTQTPAVPRSATTPAKPAPAQTRRRRQAPVTTTSGS